VGFIFLFSRFFPIYILLWFNCIYFPWYHIFVPAFLVSNSCHLLFAVPSFDDLDSGSAGCLLQVVLLSFLLVSAGLDKASHDGLYLSKFSSAKLSHIYSQICLYSLASAPKHLFLSFCFTKLFAEFWTSSRSFCRYRSHSVPLWALSIFGFSFVNYRMWFS